jgi:starvation-inducible outer membrane lipoprotein
MTATVYNIKMTALVTMFVLALSGCAQEPKIIRETVPVISSKPYKFIKPSPKDVLTKGTLNQISGHNSRHWKVKQAEAEAVKQ